MSRAPYSYLGRRRGLSLAVAAVLTVTSACATLDAAGVRVTAVEADIVFGIPDPDEAPVPPPTVAADPEQGDSGAQLPLRVPFSNKIPDRFKNVAFEVDPAELAGECPQAPIGAAPSTIAPPKATKPPAAGLYRYRISGTRKLTINGVETETKLSGFQPRVVRNVEKVSATRWTFEVVQPNGDGGVRITTWSVNTAPVQQSVSLPYVGENPVRVSEPEGGVSILSVDYFDGNGNNVGSFRPTPAVNHMPQPVLDGEEFSAAGIDARTLQLMSVTGEVKTRKTVDACGQLADGWLVTLEVTDTGDPDSASRTEELIFSTDMGGLLISQRIIEQSDTTLGTEAVDVTYSIGQLEPTAVPASDA